MEIRYCTVIFLIVLPIWCHEEDPSGPLVQTKLGKIRGHYLKSYKGNTYQAFQGIPYAVAPIGDRRFQSPVPIEPWSEELQATKIREICWQVSTVKQNIPPSGSEDCLHLNVYVPKKTNNSTDLLPVIFYIYGGGFRGGGTSNGQEQYIIDYDVIFTVANYRTGVLGFLSTEDDVVPGNMGHKDQSTALRWVHDNIENFGGDPKRITLMGGSSGAMSVHHHYLSPWSAGLFHAGISISGTAFHPVAVNEKSREKTIAIGRLINCTDEDMVQLVQCLKRAPVYDLVGSQKKLKIWDVPMLFGPVVERSSTDPFLDDDPFEVLKQGRANDVPWHTGIVAEEGLFMTAAFTHNDTLRFLNKNWEVVAPYLLEYLYTVPEEQHAIVARKIREHYFGDKPIDRENFHTLTKLVGDGSFGATAVNAAKVQAMVNKSPVFFHYYNYRATDSSSDRSNENKENLGVAHGDDTLLVIGNNHINPTKSSNDMAMQKKLIQIWTTFAHNRVPDAGADWATVASDNTTSLNYLYIAGPDNLKPGFSDNFAQVDFWNSIGLAGIQKSNLKD